MNLSESYPAVFNIHVFCGWYRCESGRRNPGYSEIIVWAKNDSKQSLWASNLYSDGSTIPAPCWNKCVKMRAIHASSVDLHFGIFLAICVCLCVKKIVRLIIRTTNLINKITYAIQHPWHEYQRKARVRSNFAWTFFSKLKIHVISFFFLKNSLYAHSLTRNEEDECLIWVQIRLFICTFNLKQNFPSHCTNSEFWKHIFGFSIDNLLEHVRLCWFWPRVI